MEDSPKAARNAFPADLGRLNVDVIVAGATQPAEGSITGLSIENPELMGKRVDAFRQAIPTLARVGVLSNPT